MKNKINKTKPHGNTKHGHSKIRTKVYSIWKGIIKRCYNKNCKQYKNYGGRGIKVCKIWRESFVNFLRDMGEPPSEEYTIERKNNNGNYSKRNCKWATSKEQSRNTRRNRYFTFNNITMILSDWAKALNIHRITLSERIEKWGIERALSIYGPQEQTGRLITFNNETLNVSDWARN